jgi:hypothetical protein
MRMCASDDRVAANLGARPPVDYDFGIEAVKSSANWHASGASARTARTEIAVVRANSLGEVGDRRADSRR